MFERPSTTSTEGLKSLILQNGRDCGSFAFSVSREGSRATPFDSPVAESDEFSFRRLSKTPQAMGTQSSVDPLLKPLSGQAPQLSDADRNLAQIVSYRQDDKGAAPGFLNITASDASSAMQNPYFNAGRMTSASDLAVNSPAYAFTHQLAEASHDSMAFPQLDSHKTVPNPRAASAEDDRREVSSKATKGKTLRLPEKARMQCTTCQKRFHPPKRTDTTLCSQCRKSEIPQTALLASAETAGADVDDTIPLPDELARVASGKNWDASISSANDATAQLLNKPLHSVSVSDDDFDEIDDDTIIVYSEELFTALLQPPAQPPSDLDAGKKEKYCSSQLQAYAACGKLMETEDEVGDASARCRLAIEEAITLHREGIRVNELTKESFASIQKAQTEAKKKNRALPKPRTRTGFSMDDDIPCTQRIEMIITAIRQNKLVALELLDGRKVSDIVRCPTHFLERKRDNFKSNRGKHDDQKVGGDLRRKKEAEAALHRRKLDLAKSARPAVMKTTSLRHRSRSERMRMSRLEHLRCLMADLRTMRERLTEME